MRKVSLLLLSGLLAVTSLSGCASSKSAQYQVQTTAAARTNNEMNVMMNVEAEQEGILKNKTDNTSASAYQNVYDSNYFNTEEYKIIVESGFLSVADHPLSTFSADVDTASYSNIRRMIEDDQIVPEEAVRLEEMINYFHYNYKTPEGVEPLAMTSELAGCPWNPESQLLLIGLKAKEIDFDNRPKSNLVFLLDVSGSMYSEDKLPLVQQSFAMLTEELTENDRVSIVTYAGYDQVILEGATGAEKAKMKDAVMSLEAGGSTAGSAGIQRAYELAAKYFIPGGNNRVILATDGDLNVGVTSEGALTKLITEKRKPGVHLSVLGFGTGNIKDNKMVALADNGDGNYRYIDSLLEAKKVLVEEMGGTLITVAKDVKLQVEFNPAKVKGYRLIGYEKRELADEDFNNDSVDAGEIGSGHNVTALYEILPVDSGQQVDKSSLKYQTERESTGNQEELLTVNIRYKAPNGNKSELVSYPVNTDSFQTELPDNLKFAAAVAEFGMILRDSQWKGNSTYESVLQLASGNVITDDYREEFVKLVRKASDR